MTDQTETTTGLSFDAEHDAKMVRAIKAEKGRLLGIVKCLDRLLEEYEPKPPHKPKLNLPRFRNPAGVDPDFDASCPIGSSYRV